ncbi:MAG: CcoQ/FixQ family Cbb3-type cytochrome c oxidase assembly chaperone [Bacteroidetes bacterium]|nr:CcoQ/FixQ family Cbb3-type cytochrome c oxidase assembly chaperone [Bacteroidota bacterium]
MLSKYLSSIEGIAAYPVFSLFIFVPFFIAVTIWVFRLDKQFLNYMGGLPLEDSSESADERK